GIAPTDMIRSLYFQNRPLNIDFLRFRGPGSAYFFAANKCPLLPTSGDAPVRLEYSLAPTFYVAVGAAYAVGQLTKIEALNLAHDPRLAPPVAGANPPRALYGLNEYGACSLARRSRRFCDHTGPARLWPDWHKHGDLHREECCTLYRRNSKGRPKPHS